MNGIEENHNGELNVNTIITDDGIIFFNEQRLTNNDIKRINQCYDNLEDIYRKYGTLNIWTLMDQNCSTREMINYLKNRNILRQYGYDGDKDI